MSAHDFERLSYVHELLNYSRPLNLLSEDLAKFKWDFQGDGVELTAKHLSGVLKRYLDGELREIDVETWANMVEGRDDVEYGNLEAAIAQNILHELANPALNYGLDRNRAVSLLSALGI